MDEKQINTFCLRIIRPGRVFSSNTFAVTCRQNGSCFIVDPGAASPELENALKAAGSVDYILLTHGHFDHINGIYKIKEAFPDAKIAVHRLDAPMLTDDRLSLGLVFGLSNPVKFPADILLEDGDTLPFCGEKITFLHTPGHSAGSGVFIFRRMLFTGDTLMRGTCGRTDFPDSDPDDMEISLRRIYDLPGDFDIYTGHDRESTLETERRTNPFMGYE